MYKETRNINDDDTSPLLPNGFISTSHEARPGFALVEVLGSTSRLADRSTDSFGVMVTKMKRSLKVADQRADDYRALLRQAADIMDMEGIGEELVADIRAALSK